MINVLLRLAYLTVTNAFAMLGLLPMSDRDRDAEILALRHQIMVLERQLGDDRVRFTPSDRAFLAALLHRLPRDVLRGLRLLIRPDTVLRWHRDLVSHRHAALSRPKRPGRPRTVRSIRLLVLRLARENPNWGYRRIHGELLVLGVKVAASTIWEILKEAGIDPAPERASSTWADFLRSQADALLACDFLETVTLSGARLYIFAVIEHASRRIRILGATAHPTTSWVTQTARNLVMDLEDTDLLHALREFEEHYNSHRPHQGIPNTRPLHPLPAPIADPEQINHLAIRRRDRLGGILHEYECRVTCTDDIFGRRSVLVVSPPRERPRSAAASRALRRRLTRRRSSRSGSSCPSCSSLVPLFPRRPSPPRPGSRAP
jgi:transposase